MSNCTVGSLGVDCGGGNQVSGHHAKRQILTPLAFALPLLSLALLSQPVGRNPQSDAGAIDAIVNEALPFWQVPGAALVVVKDDQVVHLKGYGLRDIGASEPVTEDTLFPLASCTKAFTTVAMAMLVDEGVMQWNDPVTKHVPYFQLSDPAANALVTLRDLVCHRTGVANNDLLWYRAPWGREETIRRIGRVKLAQPFRASFQYQTTMFTTAGHAVELTSGKRWEAFVRQRILEPLQMKRVNFTTTAALQVVDHASPHRKNGQGKVESMAWYPILEPEPAGSMNASARDLAAWLRFQLGDGSFDGKRLVSKENLRETHKPQNIIPLEGAARELNPDTNLMCYGMAWVIQDYRGRKLISHAGAIDGFRAHLTLVPEARLGIAILNNLDRTSMNLAVSNRLVDLFLGLPRKDWNAYIADQVQKQEAAARAKFEQMLARRQRGTSPSRELSAYAGQYDDPAYGTVAVAFEDGRLTWKWQSFSGTLEHFQYNTFVLQNDIMGYPQVVFTMGADGGIAKMHVAHPMDVEFKRPVPATNIK